MPPPVKPLPFLLRLVPLLLVTYLVWQPLAPYYARLLAVVTQWGVSLAELGVDPPWRLGTTIIARDTNIFYYHRLFAQFTPPLDPQGVPAEWVMANLVLLVPLMLATPAPSWRARGLRLAAALLAALLLQVFDLVVTIKAFYASAFGGAWSPWARTIYRFLDAFFQGFDTQLFPFAIWAGIHFRELIALRPAPPAGEARATVSPKPGRRRG